ncbi:type IV secretory system conjugative DNA transfer family protein [Aliarcobacter butzleri]|uniref:type IV secretory system conjugative DNA transfer family protein n=1 Tax=Aliarcobacter butzleri TaxID=28197 RepID=UPI00344CA058
MSRNCYLDGDILYFSDGRVNNITSDNLDLGRGLFNGIGYSLSKSEIILERKYIQWNTLNSHKLTCGTTRQGKSRKMISDIEQQIAHGDNVFIGEPKGSKDQEIIAYTIQNAIKYKREKEVIYISPYFHNFSVKFNPIYRKKNLEISSLLADLILAKEPVYGFVAKTRILTILLAIDFIERFDKKLNPYDLILMERYELSKLETESVNWLNKYIWETLYSESSHGYKWDIKKDLLENAENELEKKLIEEAYIRTLERYNDNFEITKGGTLPLRTFLTLKDLSKFKSLDSLQILLTEVKSRFEKIEDIDIELKRLGSDALRELQSELGDDPTFISKLLKSLGTVLSELTTEEVGMVLNDCKINPVIDALTSDKRGAIIIYQPFPMIYKSAALALGRIMFFMFSNLAGYVGASGVMLKRRLFVNIDEAGAILIPIVKELANKGGGLGFSLCLYTQSIADIIETLEETGARIIMDNMNTKEFFKVNDNATAKEVAIIMGTIKQASTTTTASDKRDTRAATNITDVDVATAGIIQRINERSFLLKEGNEVYIMSAPFVPDPLIKITMPIPSLQELAEETYLKRRQIRENMR